MGDEDYTSDFEAAPRKRARLIDPPSNTIGSSASAVRRGGGGGGGFGCPPSRQFAYAEEDRVARGLHKEKEIIGVSAYDRHIAYINDYVLWYVPLGWSPCAAGGGQRLAVRTQLLNPSHLSIFLPALPNLHAQGTGMVPSIGQGSEVWNAPTGTCCPKSTGSCGI
jgi:hypothetical protein